MRIPEKRVCDLCRVDLGTKPFVRMVYPLDAVDIQAIQASMPPAPPSLFGLTFTVQPEGWTFDFCTGCAEGFMPMLADLKTQAIRTWLDERARRAAMPIGDRDD